MIVTYLCASLTMLLAFAVLITYHYVADLRAENARLKTDNETACRLYDNDHRELCALKGQHVTEPYFPDETKSDPLPFSGIGITQIRDRELRQQRERDAETQPRFDKSALVTPTEQEIVEAARRASNNGGNHEL